MTRDLVIDIDRAATYDGLYGVHRQLNPRWKDVFVQLSEVIR